MNKHRERCTLYFYSIFLANLFCSDVSEFIEKAGEGREKEVGEVCLSAFGAAAAAAAAAKVALAVLPSECLVNLGPKFVKRDQHLSGQLTAAVGGDGHQ